LYLLAITILLFEDLPRLIHLTAVQLRSVLILNYFIITVSCDTLGLVCRSLVWIIVQMGRCRAIIIGLA